MQEQQRAAKSKAKGSKNIAQRKWPTVVSRTKATRSQETSGHKRANILHKKHNLLEKLAELRLPEVIVPTFHIHAAAHHQHWISISRGSIAYDQQSPILSEIYLTVTANNRIAIQGDNGSGKTTLLKALLGDLHILRTGEWCIQPEKIGYLDQHYQTLPADQTVLTVISTLMPGHTAEQIRQHLSDFLFRRPAEINATAAQLSGGEKARLSLAQIAAKTPGLLILDEITNNLDLTTRAHLIQVLQEYPGALIVVSHDADFLAAINIQDYYHLKNGSLYLTS